MRLLPAAKMRGPVQRAMLLQRQHWQRVTGRAAKRAASMRLTRSHMPATLAGCSAMWQPRVARSL